MATRREVTCIKSNNERITHIGGLYWNMTEKEAIAGIENGTMEFYVRKNGSEAEVLVVERNGNKYLRTERDLNKRDNLLSLPDCF